jgi:hypothetical protein
VQPGIYGPEDARPRAVRHCETVTGALVRCGGQVGADARGTSQHRRHAPPRTARKGRRAAGPGARETCETDDGMVAGACSPSCADGSGRPAGRRTRASLPWRQATRPGIHLLYLFLSDLSLLTTRRAVACQLPSAQKKGCRWKERWRSSPDGDHSSMHPSSSSTTSMVCVVGAVTQLASSFFLSVDHRRAWPLRYGRPRLVTSVKCARARTRHQQLRTFAYIHMHHVHAPAL